MDQVKVGSFIAEMRKKQGLTQKDLAEQLALSDKTISKWECGKSLPDPSMMIPLCSVLQINVNELLSGEKLSASEYSQKAEENMVKLIKEHGRETDSQKREQRMAVAGEIVLTLLVVWSIIVCGGVHALKYTIDGFCLIATIVMNIMILVMLGLVNDFGRAVKCMFMGTKGYERVPLERALIATRTVAIASLILGGVISIVSLLIMLYDMADITSIGPSIATALISLGYGFVIAFLLFPVAVKLQLGLLNMEEIK